MDESGPVGSTGGHRCALLVGCGAFVVTVITAAVAHATMLTWFVGYIGLWSATGATMTALWPAPELTRAQVAATRGEEGIAWKAMRPRLAPLFAPWLLGIGAFVGMAAAQRGWGGGNLRSVDPNGTQSMQFGLALAALLCPLGSGLLAAAVTFPARYAARHHGRERQWSLGRATGGAGIIGLMLCGGLVPDDSDPNRSGRVDPLQAARFVLRLFLGNSETRPGWLVVVAYASLTLAVIGVRFLVLSGRDESSSSPPGDDGPEDVEDAAPRH